MAQTLCDGTSASNVCFDGATGAGGLALALPDETRRAVAPAAIAGLPGRRRFTADEMRLLCGIARGLAAVVPFAASTALLLFPSTTAPAVRLVGAAMAAVFLAALVGLLVTRDDEHPFGWGAKVGLCAAVSTGLLLKLGGRIAPDAVGAPGSSALTVLAITAVAGALGEWFSAALRRARRFHRRVLLLDEARSDHAVAATGTDRIALYGPVPSSESAALAAFGHAGIDDAVVARPLPPEGVAALSCALRDAGIRLHVMALPDGGPLAGALPGRFRVYRRSTLTPGFAWIKRAGDVVLALAALAVLAPLLPLLALAVKLSSPGPVFFGQVRVGLRGPFRALKFRSMYVGAHLDHEALIARHGNMFKLRQDPRVTPVGRFLRRFSLDELPQLFQVLAGDMSLIGPRPPLPEEVARYSLAELRRLGIKPGLTGLWQVSGRSDVPFEQWVELDARYIEQWSPALDLWILAKTFGAVLGGRGAY